MIARTRRHLLASTLLAGAAAFAAPAHAQSAETNTQEEVADIGDPTARLCQDNPNSPECAGEGQAIIVTGSRIASPTLTSASPLQIVDAQDIDDAGVVNVQEVLLENPAFGTPGINRTNSAFASASSGTATVDLRDLGSNRTLVLVNGRRFVAGIPTSALVDLNTIPTQFIERVDILTGGASSIYGSDAVAGVVNIIYKDDFEGVELSGQIGVSQHGDDVRKQANFMIGSNFADGRGNVTAYLGYSDEGAVFSRNRKRTAIDQISVFGLGGEPEDFFTPSRPFFSSFAPQGTFFLRPTRDLNGDGDANDAGETAINRTFSPCTGAITTVNTNGGGCPTGFNRSAFRTIAVPVERYLMALRGNYDITNDISAFMEGTFAATSSQREIEPFGATSSGIGGIFRSSGGVFPVENVVTLPDGTQAIRPNPFIPPEFLALAVDSNGDGLRDIGFQQRQTSFGPRSSDANRTTFRFLAGLDGNLFGDWKWDVFYAYGSTTESQTGGGQINLPNFREALDAVPDVNDVDADGDRTEAICRNPQARIEGCVAANIFGANRLSPGAVAYLQAPTTVQTETTQRLAGANLSGNLFDPWGAGPIGLAIGTEYRKEFSRAENDILTQLGQNGGNQIPNIAGGFDVLEGYAELAVPIITDAPFFHALTARGAARVSDYSTVGTVYSWNVGLEWAPVPDVRFRAVRARATRAPNIGELFTAPSQTFPNGLVDPCRGIGATGGGAVGDRCRAIPSVALNIGSFGAFTESQADLQGIGGFVSGNPNLTEETGDTITLGVVVNPRSISWLRNFSFTFDYFDIEVDDAVQGLPFQYILDQCFQAGDPSFCSRISRRQAFAGPNNAGTIENINTAVINVGGIETEGFDTTMSYRQNLEDWGLAGMLNAKLSWTHYFQGEVIEIGGTINPYIREYGTSRNKLFGTVSYSLDDWGITLRGNYIGPAFNDDQANVANGLEKRDEVTRVGAEFVVDAQIRFTPGDNYEFYIGADNLFDNDAPLITTGSAVNSTGTETAAGTYDPIGRRFYAGARLKF